MRAYFLSVVTAGSGAAKIRVSSWNMFMVAQRFCAHSKKRVYGPFFMETAIAGIVCLDMLQQFLIPQLD
jgi:hypothetical protein